MKCPQPSTQQGAERAAPQLPLFRSGHLPVVGREGKEQPGMASGRFSARKLRSQQSLRWDGNRSWEEVVACNIP